MIEESEGEVTNTDYRLSLEIWLSCDSQTFN